MSNTKFDVGDKVRLVWKPCNSVRRELDGVTGKIIHKTKTFYDVLLDKQSIVRWFVDDELESNNVYVQLERLINEAS